MYPDINFQLCRLVDVYHNTKYAFENKQLYLSQSPPAGRLPFFTSTVNHPSSSKTTQPYSTFLDVLCQETELFVCEDLNKNVLYTFQCLNTWFLVGDAAQGDFGDAVLTFRM